MLDLLGLVLVVIAILLLLLLGRCRKHARAWKTWSEEYQAWVEANCVKKEGAAGPPEAPPWP